MRLTFGLDLPTSRRPPIPTQYQQHSTTAVKSCCTSVGPVRGPPRFSSGHGTLHLMLSVLPGDKCICMWPQHH
jgi:hypothetical protein